MSAGPVSAGIHTLEEVKGLRQPNASKKRFVKAKEEYKLEDFRIKVKLGKGAFGNVYLVELDASLNAAPNQTGPMVFAMKVLDKS